MELGAIRLKSLGRREVKICTIDAIGKATRAISSHIVEKEIKFTQTKQRRLSNEQSLRPQSICLGSCKYY